MRNIGKFAATATAGIVFGFLAVLNALRHGPSAISMGFGLTGFIAGFYAMFLRLRHELNNLDKS